MSAQDLGSKLLGGIKEESLAEILADFHLVLDPKPTDIFGISPLDRLVSTTRFPPEPISRDDDLTSTSPIPQLADEDLGDLDIDAILSIPRVQIPAKPRPVILNVQSQTPSSSTATTALLRHIASLAVLPRSHGGKEAAVVWIDTSSSFSVVGLCNHAAATTRKLSEGKLPSPECMRVARESLRHVHTIQVSSSNELLAEIKDLPKHLLQVDKHPSGNRPLGAIIIDSITHFYWQDKLDAELTRLNAVAVSEDSLSTPLLKQVSSPSTASQIISQLKVLANDFGCTVVHTSRNVESRSNDVSNNSNSTMWANAALLNLVVRRNEVVQFAPQMGLTDCLRDREKRQTAVMDAKIRVNAVSLAGKTTGGFDIRRSEGGIVID